MDNTAIKLDNNYQDIPINKNDRDRIGYLVKNYVVEKKIIPPVYLDDLKEHAYRICIINNIKLDYLKYVMIIFNNHVWLEVVSSVSYNKRLLLLPQCLRNSQLCKAEIDELGLLCESCGNCVLQELQDTAYDLGYSVLIAEGTTTVLKLIQTGKIEAVIGVSCLGVLEKSFPHMCNNAIPGIAIPLLKDGCIDTICDAELIKNYIKLSNNKNTNYIDINNVKQDVSEIFKYDYLNKIINQNNNTSDIGIKWLCKSGKRWRPALTALIVKILKPELDSFSDQYKKIFIAIESFHKASLIHDDIEDNDDIRYDEKTLHKEYDIPVALNAGDYLLGEGYRLIAESGFKPEITAEILKIASKGHCNLSIGQGEELYWLYNPYPLTVKKILDIFKYKTAPAFTVALNIGAVLGNADIGLFDLLDRFSEYLGIAYQIKDDIDDFDIDSSRLSIMLALIFESVSDELKMKMIENLKNKYKLLDNDYKDLFDINDIKESAYKLLEEYKSKAINVLNELDDPNLKIILTRILWRITG